VSGVGARAAAQVTGRDGGTPRRTSDDGRTGDLRNSVMQQWCLASDATRGNSSIWPVASLATMTAAPDHIG
jgi:hypothetical protein